MQPDDPPWKIRTRPCPFYSQGKCFFAKNCSFLHQVKSTPTIIHVTAPDDDLGNPDSSTTANLPVKPYSTRLEKPSNDTNPLLRLHLDTYTDQHGSDSDSDADEDTSDLDSPTIRKPIFSSTINTRESGLSRDSVATVKADLYESEPSSRVSSSYSLSHYHSEHRRKSSSYSTLTLTTPPQYTSEEIEPSLSSLQEGFADDSLSQINTPTSATSATAQVLEVPILGGPLRIIPQFTLADAGSSSLISNRLAKSRGPAPFSPSAPLLTPVMDPSTPFSAGALYASYQQDETTSVPASPPAQEVDVDAVMDAPSPEHVSPTPLIIPKTPSWFKPLRLASTLTPRTESRTSITTNSLEQITDVSDTQPTLSQSPCISVSPGLLYELPVAQNSSAELDRTSSTSSHIPTDTPHTIVLSDHDGYVSPLALSRVGSLDIDMTNFPPPPASTGTSVYDLSSSPASISLSELTGQSPRTKLIPRITPSTDSVPTVNTRQPLERTTTRAEQLRSALERRALRMRESTLLLASTNLQQVLPNASLSAANAESLFPDSTVSTSISHSRSMSSAPDFAGSNSWDTPLQVDSLSRIDLPPNTSASDSLLIQQQAQSSPPRVSPRLRPKPSGRTSSSPLVNSPIIPHTTSPDPSPRPQLLFAIASDQPEEVERLLSTGEASANETTGSGTGVLEFTVANEGLKNKTEIVKTLLKYGADPDSLKHDVARDSLYDAEGSQRSPRLVKKMEEGMNPALKYYLNRQSLDVDSKPALEALQQSSFAPLARARFDIIGQDRALDEFYRVLGMHSQRKGRNALVILLCGASGHGKSLLAQKVGSLLNVPTHTINMTALRSQHDLWQCLSTGMDDASPDLDLSEFLVDNQGKRCVVVLDEIEKVDDSKSLNPLLLPWDIGRCSLEQKKHTDTSQVIWIATSNLGQKLISEHVEQWGHPDTPPTRAEYNQLATAVRRRIAEALGASLMSRVTTILPFLPFTEVEKIAIGTEAALSHQEFTGTPLSSAELEAVVRRAVKDVNFVEEEGARSLYRVVETHMMRA